jgi:hypothetical protein
MNELTSLQTGCIFYLIAIVTSQKTLLYVVAHACNSSYLEGGDWEDCSLRPAWAKMFNGKKLGVVVLACHSSYGRKHKI